MGHIVAAARLQLVTNIILHVSPLYLPLVHQRGPAVYCVCVCVFVLENYVNTQHPSPTHSLYIGKSADLLWKRWPWN